MPWTIYWDNGGDAAGTWGHLLFDTEEEAQSYADFITKENIVMGVWTEEGGAEPYWLEPTASPDDIDSSAEQSIDYFDRYIAGDR